MATVRFNRKNLPKGRTDWEALDKLSDEEVERRAMSDPDARPLTDKEIGTFRRTPRVKIIRIALHMTQEEFAEAFGLSLATVRDWEQGRTVPDQAAKTLLLVIATNPDAVRAALKPRAAANR